MTAIVIGVYASERSEDAIAFGSRLAETADVVVPRLRLPVLRRPSRAANAADRNALRDDARSTAQPMRARIAGIPPERTEIRVMPNPSPAHALHDLAEAEHAALIVLGSTHTFRAGRVRPGSTGVRLPHGVETPLGSLFGATTATAV